VFTGIVEAVGRVLSVTGEGGLVRLEVSSPGITSGCVAGDSIAVNGVCLTVTAGAYERLRFQVGRETLDRSTLGGLGPGDAVNLERALPAGGRFGGHFVTGHVDGVGEVASVERGGGQSTVRLALPGELAEYIVPKGSVALDGVSLTVAAKDRRSFSVALVPFTLEHTTLGAWRKGDRVNVETDVIVKTVFAYLDTRMDQRTGAETVTLDFLREHGFA